MNLLKTYTFATSAPDTYLVYWTNSLIQPKGIIRVRVRPEMEDRLIVAELAAMRHLLVDKSVVGHSVIGNTDMRLIVSAGAIKKLQHMKSNKSHLAPYANFLTTRFAGSPISVDKDTRWFDDFQPEQVDDLLVAAPCRETIAIHGLGKVAVTQHVLERFAERLLPQSERSAQSAWKELIKLAADAAIHEVCRTSMWADAKYNRNGRHEGRYFLNPKDNLIMVVTNNPGEGLRLVTTYPASRQFRTMPKAA